MPRQISSNHKKRTPPRPAYLRKRKYQKKPQEWHLRQQTFEQARLQRIKSQHRMAAIKMELDEEQQPDYTLQDLGNSKNDLDKRCQVLIQLLNKNKIRASNAFTIDVLKVDTEDEQQKAKKEELWKKWTSILYAGNLVYGFKVEALLQDLEKFISEMSRRKINQIQEPKQEKKTENGNIQEVDYDICAKKHLQSRNSLNVTDLEQAFGTNPFFQKSKREFDEGSLRSLLLNSLTIGTDISLSLFGKTSKRRPPCKQLKNQPIQKPLLQQNSSPPIGLTEIIKDWADDTNKLCRALIGPSHSQRYELLDLNLQRIQAPTFRHLPINPGHLEWSETKSMRSEAFTQVTYHNPLTWDSQLKVQPKQEYEESQRNHLREIGKGVYPSDWPLIKKQYCERGKGQASSNFIDFNPRLLMRRWDLKKMALSTIQQYSNPPDQKQILIGPQINFQKLHFKYDIVERRFMATRLKFRKHYKEGDSDQEESPKHRHQSIRALQQRVKRTRAVRTAPIQQGQQVIRLESCYRECLRQEKMSVQKFFMTCLHMANQDGALKLISED